MSDRSSSDRLFPALRGEYAQMPGTTLLTASQAAAALALSESRLYQLRRNGGVDGPRFRQVKPHARVTYAISDLAAWADSRIAGGPGASGADPLDDLDADARAWVEATVAQAPPLTGAARARVLGALRAGLARTEATAASREFAGAA